MKTAVRHHLPAIAVAFCFVVCAAPSWAEQKTDSGALSLTAPLFAADAAAPASATEPSPEAEPQHGLLMQGLDRLGLGKPLDDAGIDVYGHIEAGYTYVYQTNVHFVELHSFDIRNNQALLNQLDLNFERIVDPSEKKWDLGGRFEILYGSDAQRIHANGQTLGQNDSFPSIPIYQVDPVQFYLDLTIPVGNGLRLRLGKFLYFYSIDPNESVFYSHGFAFSGAAQTSTFAVGSTALFDVFPLTLTGGSLEYPITEQLTGELGISTGWNQGQDDNNHSIDVFGRISADLSKNTGLTVRAIAGPELLNNNRDYRTAVDVVLSHRFSDKLTLVVNPIFGFQSKGIKLNIDRNGLRGVAIHDDYWYGVTATGQWVLTKRFSLGLRGEVFRDDGGTITLNNQWLSEVTFGTTITPLPDDPIAGNFKVRPEVRLDYASQRSFPGEHFSSRHEQLTFGIDAIFNF